MPIQFQPHRRALLLCVAGGGFALAGCEPRMDFLRFRLTLRFTLADRIFEGSSVRETWWTEDPEWFPSDNTPNASWRGEATVVPLPGRAVICGMLDGYSTATGERPYSPWSPLQVLFDRSVAPWPEGIDDGRPLFRGQRPTAEQLIEEMGGGELILRPEELPLLVAFRNATLPRSGRVIAPSQITDVFPGLMLGRSTVAITRDRVRFGAVDEALPWVSEGDDWVTPRGTKPAVVTGDFSRR